MPTADCRDEALAEARARSLLMLGVLKAMGTTLGIVTVPIAETMAATASK